MLRWYGMKTEGRLLLSESKLDNPLCTKKGCIMNSEVNLFYRDSQGKKKRQHGTEAVKSHILAAKTVANIVKSSLVCTQGRRN